MCRAYALPARISSPAVCRHRPRVPPHLARKLSIVLPEVWATKARQGQRAGVVQSRAGIRFNLLSGPYSRSGGSVHGTCDPVSLWWRRPSAASPRRPPSVGRWRWELRKRQPEKRQPLRNLCTPPGSMRRALLLAACVGALATARAFTALLRSPWMHQLRTRTSPHMLVESHVTAAS